jgi:hypothetical protein
MATKFGREPKEMTTEPSADELKKEGMKKGGHAHKKHMAFGGAPAMAPRRAMAMAPALLRRKEGGKAEEKREEHQIHKLEKELKHHEHEKAGKAHHGLKKGGHAKHHMAKGGHMYSPTPGGLLSEGKAHRKANTGAIEGPGYKHGGKAHHISGHPVGSPAHHKAMAKHYLAKHKEGGSAHHKKMHEHHKHMATGGTMAMDTQGGKQLKRGGHAKHHMAKGGQALAAKMDRADTKGTLKPKVDVQDKVVEAKQVKGFHTKTAGVEGVGYKRGGHTKKHFAKGGTVSQNVANRYLNDMKDGAKMPTKKAGTGEIKQQPAGFKKGGHVKHHATGGHVSHHTTHGHGDHGHTHMHETLPKHTHGHEKIDGHPMKRGGHVKHHSKVSTHHKKGGKACNY